MGLYEYKPVGRGTRPVHAAALRARGCNPDLMRDALSLTGLEAESCIAPMLRLRARQTTVTGANGISMTRARPLHLPVTITRGSA